jgi:hypothetical protein
MRMEEMALKPNKIAYSLKRGDTFVGRGVFIGGETNLTAKGQ